MDTPRGLEGRDIPIEGRIVSIVDVYDALVHERVYRPAMPESKALAIMRQGRGSQFDPELFDCFMDHLEGIRSIRRSPEVHS